MAKLEVLQVAEDLLRRRKEVFARIKSGEGINKFLLQANITVVVFSAVYGATMGAYPGGIHILYNIIKIPLLLLISLYVSLPIYYVLDAFSGGDASFRKIAAVLLGSFTVMATVLLAFVPVNLFFILTTPDSTFQTYAFIVLMNVTIFTIAGIAGLAYLGAGMGSILSTRKWVDGFMIGLLVQVFVGTQLAWVLRPYFDGGVFLRPLEGNFYIALFRLLARVFG